MAGVSTRHITTTFSDYPICDVCGRTLLRGERSTVYINGGSRRAVCELCETRALHEGWVREGSLPEFDGGEAGSDRRRSILGRLRPRRETTTGSPPADEELSRSSPTQSSATGRAARSRPYETRHVHAVPSSDVHKIAAAVELFNASQHRRTVAGVARSLGSPAVNVAPVDGRPTLVCVVVSWELCWYRYEVDLSDEGASVRVAGQGYELEELEPSQRLPNAVADDLGQLTLAS